MRRTHATFSAVGALLAAFASVATAQTTPTEVAADRHPTFHTNGDVLIKNGRVLTVTQGTIEGGDVLILKGKIVQVGKGLKAPDGIKVIDATGKFVTPGIVDAHSHRASDDTNEGADAITAEVRIQDILNPDSLSLYYAVASGMTTSMVLHGSANPIGGQCQVIKNKWERPIREIVFDGAPRMVKFALGENPKRPGQNNQRFPASRTGVEAVYRRAFADARDYMRAWDAYEKQKSDPKVAPPRKDLRLDALADILRGRIWVQCHSYRQDEMLMMARLSQEFQFHLCLQHALESYKIAPELAKAHIPVSMFGDGFTYKLEVIDSMPMATAICDKAGVIVSVNTDTESGTVPITQDAAKAMRYGISADHALRMVTINPAMEIGVDKRVGSLEAGKDGDVAIWQGHPLSNYTKCVMTFIDGEVFFERRDAFKVDGHSMASSAVSMMPFDPDRNRLPKLSTSYLIEGATVHPVSGPDLPNSKVLIRDGLIAAVGDGATAGPGTVLIDGKGLHVYPGFIDGGCKAGIDEIGEVSASQDSTENGEYKPDLMAIHSLNPDNIHFPKQRYNGVTTVVTNLAGGVVAGQAAVVDTIGMTTEGIDLASPAGLDVYVPVGPDPRFKDFIPAEQYAQMESGLADRTKVFEAFFESAKRYGEAKAAGEDVATDVKLDAMQPYLKGNKPVIFHADTAASIRKSLSMAKKFGLKAIIAGGAEAWQVVKQLKEANVPVLFKGPSDACPDEIAPPGEYDPYDAPYTTPSVLHDSGIRFGFMTDSFDMAMNLPFNAGRTCAFGLSHSDAIKALTLDAAKILGIDSRVGSLERGKIANVIVTDGDPLELTSQLRYLFVKGKPVALESRYTDLYRKYSARLNPSVTADRR
ncbi:MAG: amidohydrolase family protein [Fimbriimonas sp.]|nr:amidohydrolase family protein [Fimbriimonas sp.]